MALLATLLVCWGGGTRARAATPRRQVVTVLPPRTGQVAGIRGDRLYEPVLEAARQWLGGWTDVLGEADIEQRLREGRPVAADMVVSGQASRNDWEYVLLLHARCTASGSIIVEKRYAAPDAGGLVERVGAGTDAFFEPVSKYLFEQQIERPVEGADEPTGREPDFDTGWPWQWTHLQKVRLTECGFRADRKDREIARHMAQRGYTSDQFVEAYRQMFQLCPGHRRYVPDIAALQVLGLDPAEAFGDYVSHGGTITEYYNYTVDRPGTRIAGVALMLAALVPLAGGITALVVDEDSFPSTFFGTLGVAAGTGMGTAGIAVFSVGATGWDRVVPEGSLDGAPVDVLYDHALSEAERAPDGPRVFVAPVAVRRGAGVGLSVVSW